MANKIARLGAILFGITAGTGLILGAVQAVTEEPIARQRTAQKNAALAETLPGATQFEAVDLAEVHGLVGEVSAGRSGDAVLGHCFSVNVKGFGGPMTVLVGIDKTGTVTGVSILEMSETPGLGARSTEPAFRGQFKGKGPKGGLQVSKTPPENERQIQAISGATISSRAVTRAVNAARAYWRMKLSPTPKESSHLLDALTGATQ